MNKNVIYYSFKYNGIDSDEFLTAYYRKGLFDLNLVTFSKIYVDSHSIDNYGTNAYILA